MIQDPRGPVPGSSDGPKLVMLQRRDFDMCFGVWQNHPAVGHRK